MRKNRRSFLFIDLPGAALASATAWSGRAQQRSEDAAALGARLDIAPFARVTTSDVTRLEGARAGRTEEFRAEDLFLETDVPATPDGSYVIPVAGNGMGCLGLVWLERRPVNMLELKFPGNAPSTGGVRLQVWVGHQMDQWGNPTVFETLWQGQWVPLRGQIERQDDTWRLAVNLKTVPVARGAVHKVRWVFPPSQHPIIIRRLSAFTDDVWDVGELRLELEQRTAGQRQIEIYNGEFLNSLDSHNANLDLSTPHVVNLRYVKKASKPGSTRTLLRFRLPEGSCTVAVDDVLRYGSVYAPHAGLFVSRATPAVTLSQYRKQIEGKKTILERVRTMPDQILAQALDKAHHTVQDSGPTLLSLACDNAKFVLEPDGTVLWESRGATSLGLVCRFGSGKKLDFDSHLDGEWLPVPVGTARDGGVIYRQRTFVAPYDQHGQTLKLIWLNRQPIGVVEYHVENTSSTAANISLDISVTSDWTYLAYGTPQQRSDWLAKDRPRLALEDTGSGAVAQKGGKLLAYLDATEASPLDTSVQDGVLHLEGNLAPGAETRCWAYLPRWEMSAGDYRQLRGGRELRKDTERYWNDILSSGTRLDCPDPTLMTLVRATQVHGLIACRNEADGERIEQWGAAMVYRGLNALYYLIPVMDMLGFHDFARRALEFYIARYSPEGLLSDGYTLAGIGWHLQLLRDHYALTHDVDWLRRVSPEIERACWWIARQTEKTRKLDPDDNKLPGYGLAPPGLTADWPEYNYYFCLNGYFLNGLRSGVRALTETAYEDASTLASHAKDYHDDILRAYHWAQERMPLNRLRNGTWVPPYPSQVPLPGTLGQFFPDEDSNRPELGCYDVELGAHNMVPLNVMAAGSRDVDWMVDHMEDYWFLAEGWKDYPAAESERDWFHLGGFSKVQPNLCRVAEIYALRDDVRPFLRAYFNFIGPQLNKRNRTFWEDFTPDSGAWGSTEGSAYFLLLTRLMLVMERNEELWLAPFVTNNWLQHGKSVRVQEAATHFGPVSYWIRSWVRSGYIEAEIDLPERQSPKEVVIRLRHPEAKPMRAVTVNGKSHEGFDNTKEIVRLKPAGSKVMLRVEY